MRFSFSSRQPSMISRWMLACAMGAIQYAVAALILGPEQAHEHPFVWASIAVVMVTLAGAAKYRSLNSYTEKSAR